MIWSDAYRAKIELDLSDEDEPNLLERRLVQPRRGAPNGSDQELSCQHSAGTFLARVTNSDTGMGEHSKVKLASSCVKPAYSNLKLSKTSRTNISIDSNYSKESYPFYSTKYHTMVTDAAFRDGKGAIAALFYGEAGQLELVEGDVIQVISLWKWNIKLLDGLCNMKLPRNGQNAGFFFSDSKLAVSAITGLSLMNDHLGLFILKF